MMMTIHKPKEATTITKIGARLLQAGLFLVSLLFGLAAGLLLIGGGWWVLTNTTLGAQLQSWVGVDAKTAWHLSRASGTVAYLLLTAATLWGLMQTTKLVKEHVAPALTLAMHNILSWLAIILSGVHALALLFDSYYLYTVKNLVVPFTGPYRPAWVGLGVIGLYIMILTAVSFSWRGWMGQKWWRRLHYFTYLAYGLVTFHGLLAGTDSGDLGMQLMFWGSALLVTGLTAYRFFWMMPGEHTPPPVQPGRAMPAKASHAGSSKPMARQR
ncbi:MAG: ferric reductase-like transmembrane domain-containing protein [Caldilineaceae bacterium]